MVRNVHDFEKFTIFSALFIIIAGIGAVWTVKIKIERTISPKICISATLS